MARIHEILEIHDKQPDGTWKPTGKYRATVRSDEEGWIHGECACQGHYDQCPGHATAEEAECAYRSGHLSDIRFDKLEGQQHRCLVCGEWTQNLALVWSAPFHQGYHLCDQHNTKEQVSALYLEGK